MVSRFSRWPPRWQSWIAKRSYLSNSESLCRSNASHQVSAQSNLRFGRRYRFKISEWNNFSNSESLCRSDASHQVLAQSDLRFGRRCRLKNFCHLGYQNGTIIAILNLYNAPMPPIKFRLNLTYGLGGDVVEVFQEGPLAAILAIGTE